MAGSDVVDIGEEVTVVNVPDVLDGLDASVVVVSTGITEA